MNKSLENAPLRPVAARLAFKLALSIVPRGSRDWLEDMRLEAAFIEPDAERVRWAWGALWTALRFRLATLSGIGRGPQMVALASAAMVAVIAVFVVIPQNALKVSPAPSLEQQRQEAAVLDDEQLEPPMSLQAPAETPVAAPLPKASENRERTQDGDSAARLESRAVASDLAEEDEDLETVEEATSLDQTADLASPSVPSAEANTLGFVAERELFDDAESTPLSLSPYAVTELEGSVILEVQSPVWLELFEGPSGDRRLVADGQRQSGESFELSLPFYIHTENAGAVTLTLEGQVQVLGPKGVALARLFKPRR